MQLSPTELNALADHMFEVIDCSADYEEDQFAITFAGVRLYCERYVSRFRIEVGHEDCVIELPRH